MKTIKHDRRKYMIGTRTWRFLIVPMSLFLFIACSDFVEVDLPKNQLSTESIFADSGTVDAAMRGLYIQMRDGGGLLSSNLTTSLGLYTDEINLHTNNEASEDFQNHTLLATNTTIRNWWKNTYNQIYTANAIIEGLDNSTALILEESNQFKGEALLIRGYLHLLLTELFGDIPYITTTNYEENASVTRIPKDLVYNQIITDLILSVGILRNEDTRGNRTRPYAPVAKAVLARAYLYTEQWELAEATADDVIAEFGALEPDLNKVFLKDSPETIWQFKPNSDGENTYEGSLFIFGENPINFALNEDLFFAFETGTIFQPNDQRQVEWVAIVSGTDTWYHAYKYKEKTSTPSSREYSIQLRLAEQYLIRAEARARQGDISGAQADINVIRNRAGLGNTTAATLEELLKAILEERRVELFTEGGHRWFDLKRMGKAKEVLAPIKPGWKDTDVLFPIPEAELLINPNLLPQNDGY